MTGRGATGWVRWRGGQREGGDGEGSVKDERKVIQTYCVLCTHT